MGKANKQDEKDNPADINDLVEEDEIDDIAQQVYSFKKRLVKKPDNKSPFKTVINSFTNPTNLNEKK